VDKKWVIVSTLTNLDSVYDPHLPPPVKASNPVPGKQALTSANCPKGEPAGPFLRRSVDGVRKAGRAWIKLMNDRIGNVVLPHCRVHTLFDVLPARRKSAASGMPQQFCDPFCRKFA